MCVCADLTARYGLQPMLVLQSEFTSCPAMPKSQSLISPCLFIRILEGFTSGGGGGGGGGRVEVSARCSMTDCEVYWPN